jgi:hypothetical protein
VVPPRDAAVCTERVQHCRTASLSANLTPPLPSN